MDPFDRLARVLGDWMNGRDAKADVPDAIHGARFGDVVASTRGAYWHYGIYVSDDEVIHYHGDQPGGRGKNRVMATHAREFLNGEPEYWVVGFQGDEQRVIKGYTAPPEVVAPAPAAPAPDLARRAAKARPRRVLYSPEQTVERARARLGEEGYSLPVKNCEHFAMWCKTGLADSHQVERLLALFRAAPTLPLAFEG